MEALSGFVKRAEKAESEIDYLLEELNALESGGAPSKVTAAKAQSPAPASSEQLDKLKSENTKLKYRLGILQRAVASEQKKGKRKPMMDESVNMPSVVEILIDLFRDAIAQAYPDLPDPPCPVAPSAKQGDYQFNGAMPIAGLLKAQGTKVPPREVAQNIVSKVSESEVVDKLEVAGPGFVNIFLKKSYVTKQVMNLLMRGVRPPVAAGKTKQKIVVDFSSPNIAKEMHVGHLRSTIIGESVSRLLEFLGHDVLRLNHVGDWGTQFGMLIAHLKDEYPDFVKTSPPISDLMAFYKESKRRFDEDPEFKKRAYESVVKLQAYDAEHIKGWNLICDVSRKEFEKIYKRLNVTLKERGESFYQKKMESIVKELKEKGVLIQEEGRWLFFAEGIKVPLTIIKSDGGFTYDTSDMAAISQRVTEERADRIVYVTDAGQGPHFQTIFQAAKQLGWLEKVRVDHVGFGVVLGEDKKKFKTRSGDTVRLADLLDEGLKRATEKLEAKGKERFEGNEDEARRTAEALAYGCIKYADLSNNRNHEYVFSFDKMLEDKGNTAVYMLYAYTRIKSIGRTIGLNIEELKKQCNLDTVSALDHEKEMKLAKLLLRFPEVVLKIADDLFLHTLAEFMYEVATTFTEFYDVCYCVEKDRQTGEIVKINTGRIILCEVTALILAKCFNILGLEPVERM